MPNYIKQWSEDHWYSLGRWAHVVGVELGGNQFEFGTRAFTCWRTGWLEHDVSGSNRAGQIDNRDAAARHDRDYHGGQFNRGEW